MMLTAVALVIGCKRKKGDQEESKTQMSTDLDDEDYEYTRGMYIQCISLLGLRNYVLGRVLENKSNKIIVRVLTLKCIPID